MSKFKLVLPLVAATALVCTFAVQAAGGRDQAAAGTHLAMATVATGAACQPGGSCANVVTDASSAGSEPNNYVLMAAGLGVIGFIASRRRQQF